ncbi:nuclear transport factor 2 family protein [Chryseobacterium salviniae]|uniref:Nuclear transport factor 2 family protein n=1 Tax=Chryseobacterium salviniae TaxID=3101750 RepID=A0ABU6HQR0_9FLAO|nr:nuclear transport factor 2 family protein [Chryseobacterium sp. T9W2-O]MEC3875039.1 nuclear transport factor 2 family protein [Chryseobacterium sp. T9W2-O]
MNKIFALLFLSAGFCSGQKQEIEKPVWTLFTAMKNADAELLKSVFSETAVLQTITKDGVKSENINDFIASVAKMQKNDLDERIMIEAIHTDGNLASVFTPYSFYFKGKFSHCGANSFQLVKQNGEWKIQYLIDTRRKDNCKEIK